MKLDKTAEEILELLCQGETIKQIADKVDLPFHVTRAKVEGLRVVYGAKNMAHLIHLYTKETQKV